MRAILAAALALAACHRGPPPPHATPGSAATPHLATPPHPAESLTAKLEAVRAAEQLPALGLAVWRDGKVIALAVTGDRRAGDAAHPVTADDQWHLGSDTKAMTAALVGIYVDRGALRWDEALAELFPDVKIDRGYAHVTIDQLLEHRGGAPPELSLAQKLQLGDPARRADFARAVLASPPAQAPGTYAYSNAGYILLGAALERATGQRWEERMQHDLFGPLGMASCGFGPPGSAKAVDEPWGHTGATPIAPDAPGADNPPGLGPAGTVHCSLRDWLKFLAIHTGAPQTLVTPATLAHLETPPTTAGPPGERYMGGWMIVQVHPGDVRLVHEGSNTMWHAIALVVPALHETIAVVANRFDAHLFGAITPVMRDYLRP